MNEPLPQEPIQTTTWFQRNKSWAIPVGCLGLVVVLGCCGVLGAVVFGVGKGMEFAKTESVRMVQLQTNVKQAVESSPAAQEALGTPIVIGDYGTRGYNNINGRVRVEFTFRATGPKGVGDGTGVAIREGAQGEWSYERLEMDVNGKLISLAEKQIQE